MKRLHRLRNAMKWSFTALTLLLLVLWIGSGFISLGINTDSGQIWIGKGCVGAIWNPSASLESWIPRSVSMHQGEWQFYWWTEHGYLVSTSNARILASSNFIRAPLWPAAVATVILSGICWYRDRPVTLGRCSTCHYDLRGTDHAVCPECGTAVANPRVS